MRNECKESYGSSHLAPNAELTCDCLQRSLSDPTGSVGWDATLATSASEAQGQDNEAGGENWIPPSSCLRPH